MNKLDKSWAEKVDYLFQHTWDDIDDLPL